jgi:hypothetical protein
MATPYRLCLCLLARAAAQPELLWSSTLPFDVLQEERQSSARLQIALFVLAELKAADSVFERSLAQLLNRLAQCLGGQLGTEAGSARRPRDAMRCALATARPLTRACRSC